MEKASMAMSGSIPSTLSLAVSKIAGLSTNSFKITPTTGAGTSGAGQQIRVLLPTAGFIHLPSTKLYFSVTTTVNGTRLPKFTSSLIQRVQVLCGGVTISAGNPVHGIVESIKNIVRDEEKCLASEHPEMVLGLDYLGQIFDYGATGAQGTGAPESYSTGGANGAGIFSVDLGDFFQSLHPNYIDLALMAQIEVVLTVAENSVLSSVAGTFDNGAAANSFSRDGAGAATFNIVNPVCIANMVSFLDSSYPMALRQRILDQGYVQYHFNEHITFQQSFNGNSRFNLAAASLNKLHTVFTLAGSLTQGGAVPIAGSACAVGSSAPSACSYPWNGAATLTTGVAGAATIGVAGGVQRYQGKFQQFKLPATAPAQSVANNNDGSAFDYSAGAATPVELQYRINSTQVPNMFMSPQQVCEVTKYSNGLKEFKGIKSYIEFLYNKFVMSYRFNLVTNDYDTPTISGLDSRNANSMIEVVSNGANTDLTNFNSLIVADITKLVRVGDGRQLETIA